MIVYQKIKSINNYRPIKVNQQKCTADSIRMCKTLTTNIEITEEERNVFSNCEDIPSNSSDYNVFLVDVTYGI